MKNHYVPWSLSHLVKLISDSPLRHHNDLIETERALVVAKGIFAYYNTFFLLGMPSEVENLGQNKMYIYTQNDTQ